MLLHIPDVLGPQQLTQMRAALNAADWTDGRETVGAQGAKVKRNRQLPDASPLRQQLGQLVLAALAASPLYHAATLPLRTLPPRFNRYEGGGQYGSHVDGAVMTLTAEAQLRSDISCTLFLTEPDDYDGGELIVSDTYGEHEVKLPAGDLIVYPSSSLHRVTPVTRGTRLAAFFWVQSLIRDDSRRRLLFELDSSIQALTRSGADAAALLQLTGIYHNLLRQWAET
ncbi:Fe2+-dependent dioxygenase [Rhodanobacter sp. T12-5]|uniref:Fe2+-dependent dioxygenase n=1 Tax=Rhodanobacter sp. T12-5 TaxID=2024611 RepID=UPI0011ED9335|nr:Fe2+-dependent dioxygenase [Rhodanobacter sp. T12-5]KAA0070147.1 Fe2+-dependent dioxygenase [Rhodanobacter sp. T12-5]